MHVFPDTLAKRALDKLSAIAHIAPTTDGTLKGTLDAMQSWGVDRGVFLNIATKPTQQETINNWMAQINDRRVIPFGTVHPQAPNAVQELTRLSELGFRGVKLHPDYQGFFINDERMFPIYERCIELGFVVLFHAGLDVVSPDCIHALPKASAEVLARYPEFKMVLAHMGGNACWDDVEYYLVGSSAYFDTSFCAGEIQPEQMTRIIHRHGPDHILFGTDCPWKNAPQTISLIRSLALGEEIEDKIFEGNAIKLLNLTD